MNPATVIVSLLLLGIAIGFVGWPLANPALAAAGPNAKQRRRGALREEKERLLASLGDIDHDHKTGKMDDADFEKISTRLKTDTARVLREIDVNEGRRVLRPDDALEPVPAPAPITPTATGTSSPATPPTVAAPVTPVPSASSPATSAKTRFCTKCGWKAKASDDAFCGKCGAGLPID